MVERVKLDVANGHVEIYVGHAPGQRFACPDCGQELAVYDHLGERTWRHLNSMQFLTYLHARNTGSSRGVCRGRGRGVDLPICSKRWQSRCCGPRT